MSYEQDDLIRSEPDEFALACLLLAPSAVAYLGDALARVDPEDFFDRVLCAIWGYARVIHGRGDRVTRRALLIEAEAPQPTMAEARIPSSLIQVWLGRVGGEAVYPDRIPASVRAVVETARLRRLVLAADQIKHRALVAKDYAQAYGWAAELLGNLSGDDVPPEVVPFTVLVDRFGKAQTGETVVGEIVPTPWEDVNRLLAGGLHASRSYVLAGRPGAGKSNGGLNVAAGAAEQGFRVLVVSQEMTDMEVTARVLAAGGHAEYGEIVRYSMSDETHRRVWEYADTNREMPLSVIDTPGMTVEQISVVARGMKRRDGLDLLVVDYMQMVEPSDSRANRNAAVSHISRALKRLAKELGCAVLSMAQLNRDNAKGNRRPTVADLKESGSIEQDADGVMLLHHETVGEDGLLSGMVTMILGKNRFGPCGDVELRWRGHQARMGD